MANKQEIVARAVEAMKANPGDGGKAELIRALDALASESGIPKIEIVRAAQRVLSGKPAKKRSGQPELPEQNPELAIKEIVRAAPSVAGYTEPPSAARTVRADADGKLPTVGPNEYVVIVPCTQKTRLLSQSPAGLAGGMFRKVVTVEIVYGNVPVLASSRVVDTGCPTCKI